MQVAADERERDEPDAVRRGGAPPAASTVSSPGAAAEHLASAVGNRAFAGALLRQEAATATPPTAAGAPAADWRSTGNLRGSPPVRDPVSPPNTAVVEDEAEYRALLALARTSLTHQRARAQSLLDERDQVRDFRYFFAKVYSMVTENEIAFCENATFYYPTYVLRCVLYFEQIYEDNFRAFDTPGARVEHHWRTAFEQAAQSQRRTEQAYQLMLENRDPDAAGGLALNAMLTSVLESARALTESMKAHIRFDLPRAEAWVFNQSYASMPGVRRDDFVADFMSMSGVFDNAAREMQADMAEKLGLPVDLTPALLQDTAMRYLFSADMATERADTWRRAMELGAAGGSGPYTTGAGGVSGDVTAADHLTPVESLANPALRPTMAAPMDPGSDSAIRTRIAGMTPSAIAALPAVERVQTLRRLYRGAMLNEDEQTMLTILRASSGDLVVVVDGADAWDLMYGTDGDEATELRTILRERYYPSTALETALRLVRKCLDGETAEWEEEMVADIVVARSDRVALIRRIGQAYPGQEGVDDFDKGLDKLEWQLDGADERRVHEVLASDSSAPRSESTGW